jgi:hypothetical protein
MINRASKQNLVSFNKWLAEVGVTSTTGWRWRKRGILRTTNMPFMKLSLMAWLVVLGLL